MKNTITIIDNTLKFQSLDKTLKINNPNFYHIINSYYIIALRRDGWARSIISKNTYHENNG